MREIKFRAWNPDWDGMVYSHLETLFGKREFYPFGFDVGFSHYPTDGWKLMQYTGLKDKNGQETYRGDVCKDSAGDILEIVWMDNHAWGCKVLKGGALSQGLIFPLWQWDRCKENGCRQLEVIGNIYENPELLD